MKFCAGVPIDPMSNSCVDCRFAVYVAGGYCDTWVSAASSWLIIDLVISSVVTRPANAIRFRFCSKVALAVADGATDALGPHGDGLRAVDD